MLSFLFGAFIVGVIISILIAPIIILKKGIKSMFTGWYKVECPNCGHILRFNKNADPNMALKCKCKSRINNQGQIVLR